MTYYHEFFRRIHLLCPSITFDEIALKLLQAEQTQLSQPFIMFHHASVP